LIQAVGQAFGGNIIGAIRGAIRAIGDLFRPFREEIQTQSLSGQQQLQVAATLQAGQRYPIFAILSAAVRAKAKRFSKAEARIWLNGQLQLVRIEYLGSSPQPRQLITLIIRSRTEGGQPLSVPLSLIIRRPGAGCGRPMGQCPGDQRLNITAAGYTLQLPPETLIQLQAPATYQGRTFQRWVREVEGNPISPGDTLNPVMYSVLPCWGARPCRNPNAPIAVIAVYN